MTVRTKTALQAQITALIDSAGDPKISAADLRSVLTDMVDSFDFEAMAVGDALIQRINDELGDTTWQQGGGTTTGITLAQAIAAVLIDDTPVDHIRLNRVATATSVTLGLEAVSAHSMTRFAASSPDATFTESEWTGGNTSTDETIQFPATSSQHYKGFAIPASEAALTDIRVVGSPFSSRQRYTPAVGGSPVLTTINGEAYQTYILMTPDFGGPALNYQLR